MSQPVDNSHSGGTAAVHSWEHQALFAIDAFERKRYSMSTRLIAFRAALVESHGGRPCPHCEESVDKFRAFLDTLRSG